MKRQLAGLALAITVFAAGCATPPRPAAVVSPINADDGALKLSALTYTAAERNGWIEANVIRIDEEYDRFRARLQAWRSNTNLVTSLVALLANVASSRTDDAVANANYTGLNTLVTGYDAIADREQFMDRTVAALTAAMDARRAEVFARIRIGMSREVAEYPLVAAHRDVRDYLAAGRLEEGMKGLVATSEAAREQAQAEADAKIAAAVSYSEDERRLTACATHSIVAITAANDAALRQLLAKLDVQVPANASFEDARKRLLAARQNAPAVYQRRVSEALREAGLLLDPCPEY